MSDPYKLQRFIEAQDEDFEAALEELREGSKKSHWMWFVFPQLAGLGRSTTAQYFAVSSLDEARAYLDHPLLGPRLGQCLGALLQWAGKRTAEEILGTIDAMKLRSSLTLFEAAAGDPSFARALDAFFGGKRDDRTLALLNGGE
ncbi:MAG TPA: DUF1810 domain-containing protein [Sphingomicrobium sp.]